MQDRHHVHGIREPLPDGETLLWEGRPDRSHLLRHVLGIRALGLYFVALVLLTFLPGGSGPAAIVPRLAWFAVMAALVVGVAWFTAYSIERTTTYAITDRRIVIRKGIGLESIINIPFARIANVTWHRRDDGSGDIAIEFVPGVKLAWLLLWPHTRPRHFTRPQPSLRALSDVDPAAEALRTAYQSFVDAGGRAEVQNGPEFRVMDEDDTPLYSNRPAARVGTSEER